MACVFNCIEGNFSEMKTDCYTKIAEVHFRQNHGKEPHTHSDQLSEV